MSAPGEPRRSGAAPIRDHIDEFLDQWAREVPDADLLTYAIMARLRRAGTFIMERIARAAAAVGMAPNDLLVLVALRRGGPPYTLGQSQIASTMMVTMGAISKRVDRLLDAGYVVAETAPEDHRVRRITLTAAGRVLTDRFMPVVPPPVRIADAFSTFTRDDLTALNEALRRLLHAIGR